MSMLARTVVEGTLTGLHRSPTRGSSIEFAEHKPYTQGDEIRHIDWKVYGKSERYYVKQFEEETNLRAFVVLDASGSMGYQAGDRVTKLEYARMIAASLAYLLLGQSDAVGLTVAPSMATLPPRAASSHLPVVCEALGKLEPHGKAAMAAALEAVAEKVHRRSLVIVLSDLLEDPETLGRSLRRLQGRKQDVVVFHLQDPDEVEFPFRDLTRFADMEGPDEVLADPRAIRTAYREAMAEHIEALTRECRVAGIDYHRLTTDQPLDQALVKFLGWRERIATKGAR
ncbi:MAG TPA: DUF58 domain-containing protein [bacterium]|nr:DUF58 domain-containing protein [bacterium]